MPTRRKFKHLSLDDRINIQGYLTKGYSLRKIAKVLNVSPSTIYREVTRYAELKPGFLFTECKLLKSKYIVCNQCERRFYCNKDKIYYNNTKAHTISNQVKKESHEGIRCSISTFNKMKKIIEDGINKGQSINYIYHHNSLDLLFTKPNTIYYWLLPDKPLGYLRARAKRMRRYKSKYKYNRVEKIQAIENKAGKTMTDYINLVNQNKNLILLEVDSLEGKLVDKQRILTIFFKDCALQLGYLYKTSNASLDVKNRLLKVISILRKQVDINIPIVVLADNGPEFDAIYQLDNTNLNIKTFFTNPYRSTDKSRCERNHELFRYIVPKSISFNDFQQEEIDSIFSNINNYSRESLNWQSPYSLFKKKYSANILTSLGQHEISPNEVNLRNRF